MEQQNQQPQQNTQSKTLRSSPKKMNSMPKILIFLVISILITEVFGYVIFVGSTIGASFLADFIWGQTSENLFKLVFFVSFGVIVTMVLIPVIYIKFSSFLLNMLTGLRVPSSLKRIRTIIPGAIVVLTIVAVLQGQVWDKVLSYQTNIIYPITFITFNALFLIFAIWEVKKTIRES